MLKIKTYESWAKFIEYVLGNFANKDGNCKDCATRNMYMAVQDLESWKLTYVGCYKCNTKYDVRKYVKEF